MALSDKRILEEMKKRNIVISPFSKKHLSTSSYDVTLGEFYYREQPPKPHHPFFNIWEEKNVKEVWGEYVRAEKLSNFSKAPKKLSGIGQRDRVIFLRPNETILAHTNEFIGGRNTVTTMMKARSSLGRCFIAVCKCAGWGDVGYINRWTMEITNSSRYYTIPLVVGRRVAQIVFFETGSILNKEKDYSVSGKYQSYSDIGEIKKNWKPEMMLPRLWKEVKKV